MRVTDGRRPGLTAAKKTTSERASERFVYGLARGRTSPSGQTDRHALPVAILSFPTAGGVITTYYYYYDHDHDDHDDHDDHRHHYDHHDDHDHHYHFRLTAVLKVMLGQPILFH